jgi:hypothetical protein
MSASPVRFMRGTCARPRDSRRRSASSRRPASGAHGIVLHLQAGGSRGASILPSCLAPSARETASPTCRALQPDCGRRQQHPFHDEQRPKRVRLVREAHDPRDHVEPADDHRRAPVRRHAANQAQKISPPNRSMHPLTKYQTMRITPAMSGGRVTAISAASRRAPCARLIPCCRTRSAIGTPASPSFRMATICASVNRDFRKAPRVKA